MSEAKPTPGPWYADKHGRIWRRPPSDLYENGGGVAGDKPLATVNKGWFGEGEEGYPVDANASLIAEAGTVFHTTGLTPSQLVELVKELEGALRAYMAAYEMPKYGDWSKLPEPPPRTYDASYHGGDCSKHGRYYGRCHCCESDLEDARKALERDAKRAREMVFETADAAARAALSKARPNTAEGE